MQFDIFRWSNGLAEPPSPKNNSERWMRYGAGYGRDPKVRVSCAGGTKRSGWSSANEGSRSPRSEHYETPRTGSLGAPKEDHS